jgi:uncharacterized protein YcfL
MKKWMMISGVLFLTAIGCGRPYLPGPETDAPQEKNKILLMDHGLTYYFNVTKQNVSRTPSGNLLVKVDIENEENTDVWCDVQVIFRGSDGFELEKTDWEPILFHRRTVTSIQRNSMNPQASDYRIQIRNAKK